MKRRTFLRRAGLIGAAAFVAPKVLFAEKPRYTHEIIANRGLKDPHPYSTDLDAWYLKMRRIGKPYLAQTEMIKILHAL